MFSLALLALLGSKSHCQNTKFVHSERMSGLAPQSSTAFGITVTLETSLLRLISNYGKDNFDENDWMYSRWLSFTPHYQKNANKPTRVSFRWSIFGTTSLVSVFSFWYGTWEGGQLEKTPSIIIYDSIDNLSGVYTEPIKHLRQLASFFLELVRL